MRNRKKPVQSGGWIRGLFYFGVFSSVFGLSAAALILWHFSQGLPEIMTVADYRPPTVSKILAFNGKENIEIAQFFKERRFLVPYEKFPEVLVRAFIAAEDDRFFEHPGINLTSMLRASIANFKAGHVVQGGSTITQQVAKSLLLTPERSFDRKLKEVILASRIEKNLTKKQILYLYLNQIYLGHGAYGAQAASLTYFRKDVSEISAAEAALLAGLPQAPGKYSPLLNPKKAKERQVYVLRRMVENKYISLSDMKEAVRQPIRLYQHEDLSQRYAPYYVENVRKYLLEKYGEKALYEDGLTAFVPLNPDLAQIATRGLQEGLRGIDKRIGFRGPVKHLVSDSEIEKFLRDQQDKLIEQKLHFNVLTADGGLSQIDAVRISGLNSDLELLEPGHLYQGVVLGFDSLKKAVIVSVGSVRTLLTLDGAKWAKVSAEQFARFFSKGDVIWVSPTHPKDNHVILEQEPQVQGSLFSMDVQTGNVIAMVGGYDFAQSEFNRATQALRQMGSAFKPIIYAAALEKGFTPATTIIDSPIVFKDANGMGSWKPSNFDEKFHGDTSFRQALIKSRNIPTVKILQSIQVPFVIDYARRLGMTGSFNTDLSIALGSATVSLMELTRVYSLFPRLGRKVTPIFISKIVDRDGKILEEQAGKNTSAGVMTGVASSFPVEPVPSSSPSALPQKLSFSFPAYPLAEDPDQILDPRVSYVMTHLMKEVVTFGTGAEARALGRPAAGKTGTTNDSVDGWFIGFTPQVVTGVWVGFDNSKSLGGLETGARTALPIWLNFMREAVKPFPVSDFNVPPGVVFANIDPTTGKLAPEKSSGFIREAFIQGTEPTQASDQSAQTRENQGEFFKEDRE